MSAATTFVMDRKLATRIGTVRFYANGNGPTYTAFTQDKPGQAQAGLSGEYTLAGPALTLLAACLKAINELEYRHYGCHAECWECAARELLLEAVAKATQS